MKQQRGASTVWKRPSCFTASCQLLRQCQLALHLEGLGLYRRARSGCPPPTEMEYSPSATIGSPASVTMLRSRGFSSNRTFCEAPASR